MREDFVLTYVNPPLYLSARYPARTAATGKVTITYLTGPEVRAPQAIAPHAPEDKKEGDV
jgi:hypothetical protein